jgi:hypothetical protein
MAFIVSLATAARIAATALRCSFAIRIFVASQPHGMAQTHEQQQRAG